MFKLSLAEYNINQPKFRNMQKLFLGFEKLDYVINKVYCS